MRFVVALLALLAFAPAAGAQGGATVARHGDVQLLVRDDEDERDGLCVELRNGQDDVAGSCGTPPTTRMSSLTVGSTVGTRSFVGGAVPAEGTVEVELEFARGERVRARTVGGEAYTGRHAGKLAYFLMETTGAQRPPDREGDEDDPVLLRRFDAAGNLVGASAAGEEAGFPVAGPHAVRRTGGITVTASATRQFAPSVLQLDRTEISVCLSVRRAGGGGGGGPCTGPGPVQPDLIVVPHRECGRGVLVNGFVAPSVTTVELTLGNGRRMRAGTIDLSGLGTTARAVVLLVPPGNAVRSARALDRAGKVFGTQPIESAPAPPRCDDGISGFQALGSSSHVAPAPGASGQVAAGAAPGAQLLARDEGDHLCLAIGDFASDAHDCVVPPPEADFSQHVERRTSAYSAVGGLVPPGAASVRVRFAGGRAVTAAISDGGEYGGRYRGHVRFFLASTGPGRDVAAIETYDAGGALLSAMPGEAAADSRPRVIARGSGYRIFAARYDFVFKFGARPAERVRGTCFGIAFGRRAPDPHDCHDAEHGLGAGHVGCSPRRGVLIGRMTKGLRGVRFELAGGGRVEGRIVRVPRRLGGGRLWVLAVPPRARVLRLRFAGRLPDERFSPRSEKVRPFALPAPRRQCGYRLDPTF